MITVNDFLRIKMFAVHKSKQELNEMQISGELVLKLLNKYKDEVLKNMEPSSRNIGRLYTKDEVEELIAKYWYENEYDKLPEEYKDESRKKYNQWLKENMTDL